MPETGSGLSKVDQRFRENTPFNESGPEPESTSRSPESFWQKTNARIARERAAIHTPFGQPFYLLRLSWGFLAESDRSTCLANGSTEPSAVSQGIGGDTLRTVRAQCQDQRYRRAKQLPLLQTHRAPGMRTCRSPARFCNLLTLDQYYFHWDASAVQ